MVIVGKLEPGKPNQPTKQQKKTHKKQTNKTPTYLFFFSPMKQTKTVFSQKSGVFCLVLGFVFVVVVF